MLVSVYISTPMPSADKHGVAHRNHVLRDALPFEAPLQIGELILLDRSRAVPWVKKGGAFSMPSLFSPYGDAQSFLPV